MENRSTFINNGVKRSVEKAYNKLKQHHLQLNALMRAEVEYAYFNAERTLPVGEMCRAELFEAENGFGILDPSRPTSEYYNRLIISAKLQDPATLTNTISSVIQTIEVQVPQQTQDFTSQLTNCRWSPHSSLCYLQIEPSPGHTVSQHVVDLPSNEVQSFFDALELPAEKQKPDFYCNSKFRCYVAYTQSNEIVAWATMFVGMNFAFFGNAETLPSYRNQGFQSALLSARLNDAARLGLNLVYTDVEPGSPSQILWKLIILFTFF